MNRSRTDLIIDPGRFRDALNVDVEFSHAARYWDVSIKIDLEVQQLLLRLVDGRVTEIRSPVTLFDSWNIEFAGPASGWHEFVQPVPKPHYHALFWGAMIHHGFSWGGDLEEAFAYLPALRRLFDVLSETAIVKA